MEHTTLHLLYSRFWHKFLFDIGVVPTAEPYQKRTSHGMILGENMEKMSKSRGNVVNPDEIIEEFGADTLRTYEMFIGDFEKSVPWSMNSLKGCKRFLDRVWKLQEIVVDGDAYSEALIKPIHKTIKKVSDDYESLKFNTAIAALMSLSNDINKVGSLNKADFKTLITLLNPVAPHITEELWSIMGYEGMLNETDWPTYEEKYLVDDEVEIVLQINGKVRDKLVVSATSTKEEMEAIAMASERVQALIEGKNVVKVICVPKRLVNIVVK
jgi:leucyl-tRNA synthetase